MNSLGCLIEPKGLLFAYCVGIAPCSSNSAELSRLGSSFGKRNKLRGGKQKKGKDAWTDEERMGADDDD